MLDRIFEAKQKAGLISRVMFLGSVRKERAYTIGYSLPK
jgi:hypothetical protein